METPKPTLLERTRQYPLATSFTLLATLSIGILAGSVLTRNVSGKEQQHVDSSDARPLVIPNPVTLSNGFSTIAKQVGPAVVNINTESLPSPPPLNAVSRATPIAPTAEAVETTSKTTICRTS